MSSTESAEVRFIVKESGSGEPWLMLEPTQGSLAILGDGYLGVRLKTGATLESAHRLANTLELEIRAISFTRL